jgi:hypothetical protein
MQKVRAWIILQETADGPFYKVDVVGVYTDLDVAESVLVKCNKHYRQTYYIQDVILNEDNVGK